ncbi:hypothetical protein [Cohnella algarum]|uniref:hypothetical protein n=1 Tax=Cohnella algarum TaxID=2044859 RepID=UPI001966F22F|nr:hypothetical protein [Cohnella algarum]MBN2980934.1 hypothetical protein [Cohnella algarum]
MNDCVRERRGRLRRKDEYVREQALRICRKNECECVRVQALLIWRKDECVREQALRNSLQATASSPDARTSLDFIQRRAGFSRELSPRLDFVQSNGGFLADSSDSRIFRWIKSSIGSGFRFFHFAGWIKSTEGLPIYASSFGYLAGA